MDIYGDEYDALVEIRNERTTKANAVAATAIVAAKAMLTKCYLAADLIPAPGNVAAAMECLDWYSLKMAGIITALNRAMDDIDSDFHREVAKIALGADLRGERIKDRRDLSLIRESERNEAQLDLIQTDLDLCLARVND